MRTHFILVNIVMAFFLTAPVTAIGGIQFHCGDNEFDASMSQTVIDSLFQKNSIMSCGDSTVNIFIKGKITKSDAQWFKEYSKKKSIVNPATVVLVLDSLGGDLVAALSIAKNIRDYGSSGYLVVIGENSNCYSACTIILAAGYQKVVYGSVGLHRPYLTSEQANSYGYSDLKQFYDNLYTQLDIYFQFVNIDNEVLKIMWRTPSHDVHIMTKNELNDTGIGINDSILTEKENIKLRELCGPSGPSMKDSFLRDWGKCLEDNNQKAGDSPACWNEAKLKNHTYFKCRYPNGFNK